MAGLNARSHSASKSISAKPCPTGASVFFFPNGITMKQMRRGVRLTSLLLALALDTSYRSDLHDGTRCTGRAHEAGQGIGCPAFRLYATSWIVHRSSQRFESVRYA